MNATQHRSDASGATVVMTLAMAGDLTIHCAAERSAELLAELNHRLPTDPAGFGSEPPSLALDLSEIIDIDTAGLQILLSARRLCEQRGATLHLSAKSRSLASVLGTFHLDDHLRPAWPGAVASAIPTGASS